MAAGITARVMRTEKVGWVVGSDTMVGCSGGTEAADTVSSGSSG